VERHPDYQLCAKEIQCMKYWIDTEFIAVPCTIDLISVGLVAEDGREFYAESNEVDWSKANLWTLENVRPKLNGKGMKRFEIGYALRQFTDGDEHPVFWGYFPAYDWVAFCSLFGSLDELPFHYPQLCLDIKQWAIELGDPELPHQVGDRHNALLDARWTKDAWAFLARLDPAAGERRAIGCKNPSQFGHAA
jgi:3' exoribonuclease, RNase T-like